MHPIDHDETLRRGHEERLRRAEDESMARKARVEQSRSKNTQKVANWLGRNLVSWGENLEQLGTVKETRPATSPRSQSL